MYDPVAAVMIHPVHIDGGFKDLYLITGTLSHLQVFTHCGQQVQIGKFMR